MTMKIRKRFCALFLLLMAVSLSACGTKITYPHVEYRNSTSNYDILNRTILLEEGYALDEGHAYDIIETESGYDLTLHFIKDTD